MFVAAVTMLVAWQLAAAGGTTPAAQTTTSPRLLVLVSAGANGIDQVAISYDSEVSEAKARGELQSLIAATGWQVADVVVDCRRPASGKPRMTSVSFSAPAVVPYPEGTLPVAPLVQAYKHYRNLVLVFQVNRPFSLLGPAAYQDPKLSITLHQDPGIYRYDVCVTDPRLGPLHLPGLTSPQEPARHTHSVEGSGPLALVIALSFGIAASAGLIAYLALAGHGRTSAPRGRSTS